MLENLGSLSTLTVLGLGLIFGLKHATEVDHVLAVSTIVSQHKNILRSALVGLLWGAGHTASLLVIAVIVLWLRVTIPEAVSSWFEFAVALMIIGLGISALWQALRKSRTLHLHHHTHGGLAHAHVHFHEKESKHEPTANVAHSHGVSGLGWKPVLVGTMHGLAGSGALTLVVTSQISSASVGFLYVALFGVGSIVGMVLMSGVIGFPFAFTSRQFTSTHHRLQMLAAVISICFGVWYASITGPGTGLF